MLVKSTGYVVSLHYIPLKLTIPSFDCPIRERINLWSLFRPICRPVEEFGSAGRAVIIRELLLVCKHRDTVITEAGVL